LLTPLAVGSPTLCGSAAGIFLALASSASLAVCKYIPRHHDMRTHSYRPGECEAGRLYYEGDIPILSLHSDDPFQAGRAQGYLCGDAISRMIKKWKSEIESISIFESIASIKGHLLPDHLREMEGLVSGYNQWVKEQYGCYSFHKLTIDNVISCNLIPETMSLCSVLVDWDPAKGFVFTRNLDFDSSGILGSYSIVINRRYTNGLYNTVEVGIPILIGTLTGMNNQGLSMAMNSSDTFKRTTGGMPSTLYNRFCLERSQTVQDVERFVKQQSPLSSYHLTVADPDVAESIHFYQAPGKYKNPQRPHPIRRWQLGRPLCTLNGSYNSSRLKRENDGPRQRVIDSFLQERGDRSLENVRSLPLVNGWRTFQCVVMEPETRTMKVVFDNAFAGNNQLHLVPSAL
jgi:hypothetical protein